MMRHSDTSAFGLFLEIAPWVSICIAAMGGAMSAHYFLLLKRFSVEALLGGLVSSAFLREHGPFLTAVIIASKFWATREGAEDRSTRELFWVCLALTTVSQLAGFLGTLFGAALYCDVSPPFFVSGILRFSHWAPITFLYTAVKSVTFSAWIAWSTRTRVDSDDVALNQTRLLWAVCMLSALNFMLSYFLHTMVSRWIA